MNEKTISQPKEMKRTLKIMATKFQIGLKILKIFTENEIN